MTWYLDISSNLSDSIIEVLFSTKVNIKNKDIVISASVEREKPFLEANTGWYVSKSLKMPFTYFPKSNKSEFNSITIRLPASIDSARIYLVPWAKDAGSIEEIFSQSVLFREKNDTAEPFLVRYLKKEAS